MRRKYWLEQSRYGNELYYTESAEDEEHVPEWAKRITRKEAIRLARAGARVNREEPENIYYIQLAEEIEPINMDRYHLQRFYKLSKERIWEKEWFYDLFFLAHATHHKRDKKKGRYHHAEYHQF